MKKIYSGFFLEDGTHCTWEYAPRKCTLPEGIQEGDEVTLFIVGEYADDEVKCDVVQLVTPSGRVFVAQPDGTVLHITRYVNGVSPVVSGQRATSKGFIPKYGVALKAKAGYFYAK